MSLLKNNETKNCRSSNIDATTWLPGMVLTWPDSDYVRALSCIDFFLFLAFLFVSYCTTTWSLPSPMYSVLLYNKSRRLLSRKQAQEGHWKPVKVGFDYNYFEDCIITKKGHQYQRLVRVIWYHERPLLSIRKGVTFHAELREPQRGHQIIHFLNMTH